ncbi:MoaA/NifB/PqqE/SkfB family radical SAM enzyme [Chryseobacterium defluvii]|uniref:MoaA/NifB/PqqE/SkfB family radical SAM enzyme n=1 Tax=Chryseobacterium defluvii TaxID=160396 RepID=A0A840KGL3_9FLAO|nr:radical SAM protein [Chryseobacterium defluvii]MBB4808306.1 MoaA/NifB/PqqE/SkfB family radical SAM enzyme [Chryseobacterium defluvii]
MEKFILNPQLKIRKEVFGCIVLINERKSVRFFNKLGYQIISALKNPKSILEIYESISENFDISKVQVEEIEEFVKLLKNVNICFEFKEQNVITTPIFYFEDILEENFSEEYFYSPLGVEIESTNKCARECSYCSYFSNPRVDISQELSWEDWLPIIKEISDSGVFYVRFTGGDPFTRRDDLLKMISYADSLGLMVSIGSDLTLTTEMDVIYLSKLKNFVFLQTTLDGSTKEICERYRGKGNFLKVIKGMELLHKHKVPFIVGTVLTKYNKDDIYNIGKLISQYEPLGYSFAPLYIAGRAINLETDMPNNEELYHANLQLKQLVNDKIIYPADSAWQEIVNDIDEDAFKNLLNDQPLLTRTGERLMRITPQGHCYVSVKLKRIDVENDVEWNAGSIIGNNLIKIWQKSDKMNNWRSLTTNDNSFGKTVNIKELL